MRGKREFVQHVLNHMEDRGHISGWDSTPARARNDYYVRLNSGRLAVIDLKGCLDGENTNKFERPADADEFHHLEPVHQHRCRPPAQRLVRHPHTPKR